MHESPFRNLDTSLGLDLSVLLQDSPISSRARGGLGRSGGGGEASRRTLLFPLGARAWINMRHVEPTTSRNIPALNICELMLRWLGFLSISHS